MRATADTGAATDWGEVLRGFAVGERAALAKVTQLVTGHLARLRAYEDRQSWQDLVQEVLAKLLQVVRRNGVRDPRAFVNYVGMVVRNELFDWRAREGREPARPGPEARADAAELALGADDEREPSKAPDRFVLARAVQRLSEGDRALVKAIYVDEMTYDEASTSLGIPRGSVGRIVGRIISSLRRDLGVRLPDVSG